MIETAGKAVVGEGHMPISSTSVWSISGSGSDLYVRDGLAIHAALALSVALCMLLSGGSAAARSSFTTFDVGGATAINSVNTVTGIVADASGDSFVRTEDGTVTTFAV